MSIRKSLGQLVTALGGEPTSKTIKGLVGEVSAALGGESTGKTVAEQIDNIAIVKEPLFGLKVDVDIDDDEDLFGKVIGDLQANVDIYGDTIRGTLFYVDDYKDFSGNPEEQKGHYVVLHASVPDVEGVTIKFKGAQEVTLDSDGIIVVRVPEKSRQISFTASKSEHVSVTKTFKLKGLALKQPPR